jgi:hypothetical protein
VSEYGDRLFPQHQALLKASAISVDVATERGYVSVDTKKRLEQAGFSPGQRIVPGMLIPVHGVDGTLRLHQHRPDTPRLAADGRERKYETATGSALAIDVPLRIRDQLADPSVDLWITEGARKADAAVTAGLTCVALLGVWGWRGSNGHGGKTALADWHEIALNERDVYVCFDSDVMVKDAVRKALSALTGYLASKSAAVRLVYLPNGESGAKTGLDDYLAAGHTIDELYSLARDPRQRPPDTPADESATTKRLVAAPIPLEAAAKTFRRWLHLDSDDAMLAVAAAVVGNLAPGDPCWLLLVAPPSSAKTEIVRAIDPLPYVHMASTVTEASLLSGTSAKERAKDATGGLLRMVDDFGILCFKDFTSTLSQNKDTAKQALSALREVYDGAWERPVGTDGGKMLRWRGKCGLIGAVVPSIDRYGQVVSALGDRYLLLRLDAIDDQDKVVDAALWHDENAERMRGELADAMTGLIAGADLSKVTRTFDAAERRALARFAIYAARARTVVERDGYAGDLLVMPQPEGPGRLALALKRIYGGLEALSVDNDTRWRILSQIAVDCVPSVRTALIQHLLTLPAPAKTDTIAEAVGMVKKTAERYLEDLALLDLAIRDREGAAVNAAVIWSASP